MKSTQVLLLAAVTALLLAGCDSVRNAAGLSKSAPDEFAVVTKAPLIIPPDFNLMPPRPGAAPLNQVGPTQAAQSALFNNDPAAVAAAIPGDASQGEKLLIANAGAASVSPTIRQQIAADNAGLQATDSSFTDRVLFGGSEDEGTPVDADAEAERLGKAAPGSTGPATSTPTTEDVPMAEDKGGWFDWLF